MSPRQKNILIFMSSDPAKWWAPKNLAEEIGIERMGCVFDLGLLESKGFLESKRDEDGSGKRLYRLIGKGKRFVEEQEEAERQKQQKRNRPRFSPA